MFAFSGEMTHMGTLHHFQTLTSPVMMPSSNKAYIDTLFSFSWRIEHMFCSERGSIGVYHKGKFHGVKYLLICPYLLHVYESMTSYLCSLAKVFIAVYYYYYYEKCFKYLGYAIISISP